MSQEFAILNSKIEFENQRIVARHGIVACVLLADLTDQSLIPPVLHCFSTKSICVARSGESWNSLHGIALLQIMTRSIAVHIPGTESRWMQIAWALSLPASPYYFRASISLHAFQANCPEELFCIAEHFLKRMVASKLWIAGHWLMAVLLCLIYAWCDLTA